MPIRLFVALPVLAAFALLAGMSQEKTVSATKFILTNAEGEEVAVLGLGEDGEPSLRISSPGGQSIWVGPSGISVDDANETTRMWLGAVGLGEDVFYGSVLSFYDGEGRQRALFAESPTAAGLIIFDEAVRPRIMVGERKDEARFGLDIMDGEKNSLVVLAVREEGPRLSLTDGEGQTIFEKQ